MTQKMMKRKKSGDIAAGKALKIKKFTKEPIPVPKSGDEESLSDDYDGASSDEEQSRDVQAGKQVSVGKVGELSTASPTHSKADLYKPPTSDELAQLKETEMLFKSSLFSMQIKELLNEIMIGEKKRRTIDAYLHKLKEFLSSLKSGKQHELSDLTWLSKSVRLPFLPQPTPSKGKFKFAAPDNIKVVGSYLLGTCIKPDPHVDITVALPKECLQAKDHLNQRYLLKRALYLTVIAQKLKKSNLAEMVFFCYSKGNHTRPVVIIKPSESCGKGFTIRIHANVESGTFKLNRFHIKKNNLRTNWFYPDEDSATGEEAQETEEPATPHYNTWNLIDLTQPAHVQYTHSIINNSDGVKDGIALLKVWLHQRELDVGQGCFSGFIMTMYVAYLLAKKKLNGMMSSYQIMRNTLLYLGQENWTAEGISLVHNEESDPGRPSMEDFQSIFEVVFVDTTGYVNLCADMLSSIFNAVKHEANLSIQFLETPGIDSFEALFMTPVSFFLKFDMSFHLSSLENLQAVTEKFRMKHAMMDYCGDYIAASVPTLMSILSKSIGKRTKLIYVKMPNLQQWAVNEEPRGFADSKQISFGVLLDLENAGSVVDKGPLADSAEAKEFQALWGEKSELRRFQDASIREAVVWPSKTNADRRTIIGKIVKHILNRHADIPRETITIVGNHLDPLLKTPQMANKHLTPYGTGEERHLNILQTFDELSKQIRGLQDLPLTITSIQGTSSVFRYSEVFPPMPATSNSVMKCVGGRLVPQSDLSCPTYTRTIKVLCLLESSGKWPDDLEAIRRVKAAFHIQLGRSLHNQHGLTTSPHTNYVDVLKKGYVFRLEIGYPREMTLLKMVTNAEGMTKIVNTVESLALEKSLVLLPKLTSTIHGIQQQNGSFSIAVRLAKRWLSSHMLLGDHIPHMAVDLIMSHVYTTTAPFSTPNSPLVGFCRFLSLLCTHDWAIFPLIINLNSELKSEDYTEIRNRFSKNRKSLPLMFLATSYDKFDSVWTKEAPSAPILRRIVLLAQESRKVLNGLLLDTRIKLDFRQIFRPPLDVYDAIIHLNPKQVPRYYQGVDLSKDALIPKFKLYEPSKEKELMPVVNYNPVEKFLAELRAVHGELALFFYDQCGGDVIAVLWKPAALQSQKFKVNGIHARRPQSSVSDSDIQMTLDIPAVLEDFRLIGDGLVTTIDLK